MASSFFGLYVQRNALNIAQKALDITGNNISNINTKGYSRQRLDICSIANARNTLGYHTAVSLAGMGSDVIGVAQIRSKVYDKQVRTYSGSLCDVGVKANTLADIEDIFDSIEADSSKNEASFAAIINKLKAALQSYSTDHADRSEMASITKSTAESVAQAIRNYALHLDEVAEGTLEDTKNTVDRINEIFAEMASLNKQIKDSYISMGYITSSQGHYNVQNQYGPLELKDKMNLLLDELSQYGNIEYKEESDGTFTVHFAEQLVVSEKYYAQMALTEEDPNPTELSFIIITGEVDKNGVPINGGLYDKDQWYDMNIAAKSGGDSAVLLRKLLRGQLEGLEDIDGIDEMAGMLTDITGKDVHGINYIRSGALRGYLDMYNGRGLFADDSVDDGNGIYQAINDQLALANKALAKLAGGGLTQDEIYEIKNTLKSTINAKLEQEGNNIKVTVNGVTLYDSEEGIGPKELTVENPDSPNKNNACIKADGETVRTIALNSYQGTEYYRDLLNTFVKTISDEFNKVYGTYNEATGEYEPMENPYFDPNYPESPSNPRYITLFEYGADEDGTYDFRKVAENFRLSELWILHPDIVANPTGDNEFEELDNTYVHKLLALFTNDLKYKDGHGNEISEEFPLDKFVTYINRAVGQQLESATQTYDATNIMLTGAETERSDKMDVSMDEEGINMMNYQKWYNAISRMISTLDEALDKLINQTGLVGLR